MPEYHVSLVEFVPSRASRRAYIPNTSIDSSPDTDVKKRYVQRRWRRDPNGKTLVPQLLPPGKHTSNGTDLWGETLLDFYWTYRIPSPFLQIPIVISGSKMAAWVRELGELDWAKDELEWADHIEGSPVEVLPYDIGGLIEDFEMKVAVASCTGMGRTSVEGGGTPASAPSESESTQCLKSPFDPSSYPSPWPLLPFSGCPPLLQKRLPRHLLPHKLVVHDPWDLLAAEGAGDESDAKWTSVPDRILKYQLHLTESTESYQSIQKYPDIQEVPCAKEVTKPRLSEDDIKIFWPNIDVSASSLPSPPIMVRLPARPPPPISISEAHLYLSPAHYIGEGNHSIVYDAEWELPRSLLVGDILCLECISDNVRDVVKGGGGELLTGEICFTGQRQGVEAAPYSITEPSSSRLVGDPLSSKNTSTATTVHKVHVGEVEGSQDSERSRREEHLHEISPAATMYDGLYKGPIIRVGTMAEWQNPERGPYCTHIQQRNRCTRVPLTVKVRVAAKLSIEHDPHLAAEAQNYESFSSHLFEHWNGLNVMEPLFHPVPVGAVVPQYYGCYVPENMGDQSDRKEMYLSPILLLENCGVPIEPEKLGIDDREECASLFFRFHRANWVHGSVAPRNVVVQDGPLTEPPGCRQSATKSFRLIDFGRSQVCDYWRARATEEDRVNSLFEQTVPSGKKFTTVPALRY
ncbi:hypothetical protein JB92DRAFT_2890185 [Gautieria morchelliformis]|nr:hypothetical protein JB92DRAFT_2890185 [Gautieria morchelliformis]